MAVNEGIRSPFPTQPLRRSPKLRVYEYLHALNQKLQESVEVLQGLEKCHGQRQAFLRSFQIELEDVRAQANLEVLEQISDQEQHDWARFGKMRRQWDRQLEDPDDVYPNVQRREEERRQKGLSPRIGVVPYEAVADEEERSQVTVPRRKRPRKKQRRR